MIELVFPKTHNRYASLPLLGTLIDGFVEWLSQTAYPRDTIRTMLLRIDRLDRWLRQRDVKNVAELDADILEAAWKHFYRRTGAPAALGAAIRALARYLDATGILLPLSSPPHLTPSEQLLARYKHHLADIRGLVLSTIEEHLRSVSLLLDHLDCDPDPSGLPELTSTKIESFVCASAERLGRGSQQHRVAHLRSFLRFLAARGKCPAGLDETIDTPRVYRHEQLPRALPWDTVEALLQSIDRSTAIGLRDYTMLFLIATYGLRVSEVAALTLDDIHWREGWLRVPRCKTRSPLSLPLTDTIGSVLLHYLREARPTDIFCRALFLRSRLPIVALGATAVSMVFDRWAKRSGLTVPFYGAHCLRHAYAVHLLRTGASLKTIGDLLGHRDSESTCVYLHLATEELREVALPLPTLPDQSPPLEG